MRILLANPNTTQAVTDRLHAAACAAAAPGTVLVPLTAPYGAPFIASRAEAAIGARAVGEMLAAHAPGADAAIVAAFADPGLLAARERLPFPVVGLAEAAMHAACLLGRRFGVVSFSTAFASAYGDMARLHGLASRFTGARLLDRAVADVATVAEEAAEALVALARQSAGQDGAHVVILAGGPLAGLAARVRDRVPVPLVDGAAAATKLAEAVAALSRPAAASSPGS